MATVSYLFPKSADNLLDSLRDWSTRPENRWLPGSDPTGSPKQYVRNIEAIRQSADSEEPVLIGVIFTVSHQPALGLVRQATITVSTMDAPMDNLPPPFLWEYICRKLGFTGTQNDWLVAKHPLTEAIVIMQPWPLEGANGSRTHLV